MSLKNKLAALKAKHTPKPPAPKIDKWAKLRRIAEEEPEAFGDAVSELTVAFVTLADAADALAENLDLMVPEGAEVETEESKEEAPAEKGEKAASKKKASKKTFKFAAALKRIAAENPGSLAEALSEVYGTLDTVAEGIENLAQNLGIDLAPVGDDLGGGMDMGMGDDLGMDVPPADPALDAPGAAAPVDAPAADAPLDLDSEIDSLVPDLPKESSRKANLLAPRPRGFKR